METPLNEVSLAAPPSLQAARTCSPRQPPDNSLPHLRKALPASVLPCQPPPTPNSPTSNVSWRTQSAHTITAEHNAFVTKPLRKMPRNSSPQLGRAVCLSLSSPRLQCTDLCCEPEAGRQSSLSPCTWGNRGAPSRSCPPHSHRFPQQPLLAQALVPLSQALGSTVGRRKKRKRRQHPRGLSGPALWAWGPESVVAGVGGQEEGSQELLGRWKASLRIILRP